MRKLLAIAILISFVAPASAERGFINGLGKLGDGSRATKFVPTPEQSQRHRAFFQSVIAEQQARNIAREEQRNAQIDRNVQKAAEAGAAQNCTVLKTFAGARC